LCSLLSSRLSSVTSFLFHRNSAAFEQSMDQYLAFTQRDLQDAAVGSRGSSYGAWTVPGAVSDDQLLRANPSSLIFGVMGVGTFLVFFFAISLTFIWVLAIPCTGSDKLLARGISTLVFIIIMLILFFAPHSSRYANANLEPHQYDYSVIPRIAITTMMILFTIFAGVQLVENSGDGRESSTADREYSAFWVE